MITRFRIEASGKTREECVESLNEGAEKLMKISGVNRGLWQCTDEVTEKKGAIYQGRAVWKAQLRPRGFTP